MQCNKWEARTGNLFVHLNRRLGLLLAGLFPVAVVCRMQIELATVGFSRLAILFLTAAMYCTWKQRLFTSPSHFGSVL